MPVTAAGPIRLCPAAARPGALISLLPGRGATVGQWRPDSPVPAGDAFTGSNPVGENVRRAAPECAGRNSNSGSISRTHHLRAA